MIDVAAVVAKMPHRYPDVLVDRVTECEPGRLIRGLKAVTINEPYFQGHFPARCARSSSRSSLPRPRCS